MLALGIVALATDVDHKGKAARTSWAWSTGGVSGGGLEVEPCVARTFLRGGGRAMCCPCEPGG